MRRLACVLIAFTAAFAVVSPRGLLAQATSLAATDAASRAALRDSTAKARQRWQATRPLVYRVQIERHCECVLDHGPWVVVRGDSILADSLRGDQRGTVMRYPEGYTVDGLFRRLAVVLQDSLVNVTDVRFDPILGYPVSFTARRQYPNGYGTTAGWEIVRVLGFEAIVPKERFTRQPAGGSALAPARPSEGSTPTASTAPRPCWRSAAATE